MASFCQCKKCENSEV